MNSWQKPFLKFVAVAAINAGAFVAYRLHIHNLNKKKKKEAASIVASKNVKVYMKLDDPDETFKLFEESVKENKVEGLENTVAELKTRKHKKEATTAPKNVKPSTKLKAETKSDAEISVLEQLPGIKKANPKKLKKLEEVMGEVAEKAKQRNVRIKKKV